MSLSETLNPYPAGYQVLYISYDGMLEPLGKSQVLNYLKGLAKVGIKSIILSFEKKPCLIKKQDVLFRKTELSSLGIKWKRSRYHKNPALLSTFLDVCSGFLISVYLIIRYKVKLVHARSYVPALIALLLKVFLGVKFIFDMRGFWVDERVEAGIWAEKSLICRLARFFERLFLLKADTIVVLTRRAEFEIRNHVFLKGVDLDIAVIPTCVDMDRFHISRGCAAQGRKKALQVDFVYSGSLSTWFLPDEMLKFFDAARSVFTEANLLVLTGEVEFLRSLMIEKKIDRTRTVILSVDYESMGDRLCAADTGIVFYKPGYSRKACCPTKIGEYLACGLPVIINSGVGDTDEIIKKEKVGIIIEEFSRSEYIKAADLLKGMLKDKDGLSLRCRGAAEKYFSLQSGIDKYRDIYRRFSVR